MKKLFRGIGSIIAALLVIAFSLIFATTVWLYNVSQVAFDEAFYARLASFDVLYAENADDILRATLQQTYSDVPVGSTEWYTAQLFTIMPPDVAEEVTQLIMPKSWFDSQFDRNIEAIFTWYEGTSVRPNIYFETDEIQRRLTGQEGETAVRTILQALPACAQAQENTIAAVIDESAPVGTTLPACNPQSITPEDLTQEVVDAANNLPSTVPSEEERSAPLSEQERRNYLQAKAVLRIAESLSVLMFLVPAVALMGIWAVIVRSPKGFFGWVGIALLLGGLVGLAVPGGLTFLPVVAAVFQSAPDSTQLQAAFLLTGILTEIARPMLLQAGIAAVLGLVFFVINLVMPKPADV